MGINRVPEPHVTVVTLTQWCTSDHTVQGSPVTLCAVGKVHLSGLSTSTLSEDYTFHIKHSVGGAASNVLLNTDTNRSIPVYTGIQFGMVDFS